MTLIGNKVVSAFQQAPAVVRFNGDGSDTSNPQDVVNGDKTAVPP